jgi:basic membrane protein A
MTVINEIREGIFDGRTRQYVFTMKNGSCDIAPYHYFEDKIPESVKAEIAAAREAIINGTLTVPLVTSRP